MLRMEERQIAAVYCRLSKEDDDKLKAGDESGSIQNQKLLLMEYALSKGFGIYKVYVDDDYSGFSDRPQFKQMLADAEKGLFNIVLCKHQSRFTRDMQLVEKYIHGYFVEWGIRFISLTDNVDTAVKGGKKSRQINGLINEWYCEDLSENVKSVIKAKREQGQFVGAFASYGYKKDPENKNKLIVDEESAEIVREIFRLYLSGFGIDAIAGELTAKGIMTPAQYKKSKGSNYRNPNEECFSINYGAWSANTVRRILRNELYIGNMVQGREKSLSYKTKKLVQVPRDQWAVVAGTHEPIVDKGDFDTVQNLIDSRRGAGKKRSSSNNKKAQLLARKMKCADCGSLLHRGGQSKDGSTVYYRCRLFQGTRGKACTPHNINSTVIEKALEERICDLLKETIKNHLDEIAEIVGEELLNKKESGAIIYKQLKEIEGQLEETEKSISMMYSDRLKGLITESEFMTFKKYFNKTKRELEVRQKEIEIKKQYSLISYSDENLMKFIEQWKGIESLSHEIINDFIQFIAVRETDRIRREQEIVIHWNF